MTPPATRFLGIDAGGTKAAWAVLQGDSVVGEGACAAIQLSAVGADVAATRLQALIADAAAGGSISGVVAGLAGAGSKEARSALRRALQAREVSLPLRLAGDVEVAAAAALPHAAGVALWSGTGSFAVARDANGNLHRVGGRGWLLGDQGSAFDMARRAAVAVIAAADEVGDATSLTRALTVAADVADPLDLGRRLQTWAPGAVAALYPLVRVAAEQGDLVARELQRAGAAALAQLALVAARRASLPVATLDIVLGGGVLRGDDGLLMLLRQEFARAGTQRAAQRCSRSPSHGAAELARACALGTLPLSRWIPADDPA